MIQKASKANALEWQREQEKERQNAEDMENQLTVLYYASEKGGDCYPCATTIEDAGHPEIADMVRKAEALLRQAHYALQRKIRD